MATNDQFKALVRSHGAGDDSQFYAVAMQVAARAARAGQSKFAQELRDLVDSLRASQPATSRVASVTPLVRQRGELSDLLTVTYSEAKLGDLTLSQNLAEQVSRVLHEQRQRDALSRHGLTPARRLLLTGPPGTGKTSTAHAIAAELGLPLFSLRLDTVITKFMGETAAKLRLVFDALADTRAVYLFDEVDALGGNRATANDVGEIRRVLNSFLQFLEEDTSESVIIAATNHPQLLDVALFRRFDTVMRFDLPDAEALVGVMRNKLASFDTTSLNWSTVVRSAQGLSHAEAVSAAEGAAKDAVLRGSAAIAEAVLVKFLEARPRSMVSSEGPG